MISKKRTVVRYEIYKKQGRFPGEFWEDLKTLSSAKKWLTYSDGDARSYEPAKYFRIVKATYTEILK